MSASHSNSGGAAGGHANSSTLPFDIYDAGMANLLPPSLTPVRIQDRDQQHLSHLQQQQQQQAFLHQQQQQQQQQYQRREGSSGGGGGGGAFGGL